MRGGLLLVFGAALLSATLSLKLSAREENWEHIKLTDGIFKKETVQHDDNKKWINVVGEWKDSGSSYSVVTPSGGWHYGPSRIWSKPVQSDKYVITSRGKTSGGKGCGHVFKYRTGSVSSNSLVTKAWGYFLWSNSLYISSSGKEAAPRISSNHQDKWYTLKSVVNGTNVKMYIDDELVYTLDMKGEGADAKNDNYVGLWCHSSTQWEGDSFSVGPSGSSKVCPRLSLSSGVYVGPSSCAQSNSSIGAMCSFSCARGYRLIGPPSINCTGNGAWTDQSANVTCEDINECELNNGGCSHKCLNVPGNFTCSCPDPGLNLSKDERTCDDINECELNNGGCTHKCDNVGGSFTCSCPDPGLSLADDRRTCVAAGVTVSCGKNDMSITLPKSLLRGLDRRHLRLLNTSCQATETASHFILKTPLTSCGTTTSHKNGVIVFNNKVLEIPVPSGRLVTDVRKVEVPFHCYYSDRGLVTGVGVQPSSRKLVFSESGQGNFTLSLDIFSSDSFQEKFNREDFPISVTLRAPLYIELAVHNRDKELSILAETCFATPSANPYTGPRYELITDGCAAVNTVKILKAPTVQQQRFSSELFKFMSDHPFVFIHCQVRICITAEGPNSRCAQGCRNKAGLVRRDVSSDMRGGGMYSLAEGPVLLEDRLMKTPDVDQLRGSGIKAPLLIVMVIVGALCIMGVSYTIFGKTGRCSKIFGTNGCRK